MLFLTWILGFFCMTLDTQQLLWPSKFILLVFLLFPVRTGTLWELNALCECSFGQWASFCTLRWKEKACRLQLKKNISPVTSYFNTALWLMTQLVCSYISTTVFLQYWQEFLSFLLSEKSQGNTRCCMVITFSSVGLLNDILWYIKRQLWI